LFKRPHRALLVWLRNLSRALARYIVRVVSHQIPPLQIARFWLLAPGHTLPTLRLLAPASSAPPVDSSALLAVPVSSRLGPCGRTRCSSLSSPHFPGWAFAPAGAPGSSPLHLWPRSLLNCRLTLPSPGFLLATSAVVGLVRRRSICPAFHTANVCGLPPPLGHCAFTQNAQGDRTHRHWHFGMFAPLPQRWFYTAHALRAPCPLPSPEHSISYR